MNRDEILEKLFRSFQVYYDVKREGTEPPFVAEAVFHTHDEHFFLVKSAVISEAESREYVYFAAVECLDQETLLELDHSAWARGMEKVRPHGSHRNTDVALIIVADTITEEAFAQVSKLRHYQSYRFGFHGWSNYRLVAIEQSSGRAAYNRLGRSFKKLVCNTV
ncbi:MAG: hypothetical protein K2H52_11815 [Lachnospiraceae bacterium]|nr:hypothetical protein [Lachnospiraceae bacterium]